MEKVVIIGGGVGGLITAKTLAEIGIFPLLLEKNKNFGQKACGEMVAEEFCGFRFYDFLKDENIILKKFDRIIINFWGKEYFFNLKDSPLGFKKLLQINKKAFEESLAKEAEKLGAKIFLGREVKKLERVPKGGSILINDEIEAKIVIGADGFHSIVRKFTGQEIKNYGFAISGYAESEIEYPYFVFDPKIVQKGYAWIFPRKEKEANIGCGGLEIKKVNDSLERFLKKFDLKITNKKGAFIPAQLPLKTYFDNIILVGESACFTDAFWGGGINTAIFSGYLAANTVKEAILNNDFSANFLKKYEKEWKKRLYKSLVKNYLFQKIFSNFLINQRRISSFGLSLFQERQR